MENSDNQKRSVSAIIALVLAVTGLLLSAVPIVNNFAFVLAILAFILGIIGFVRTRGDQKKGRTMAIISVVLAVLAGAIVLASQKFYVDTIDTAGKQAQESFDTASGKNTDEILGKEVDVKLGAFEVIPSEYTTETKLPVKVTNKNSAAKSYTIQVEAVDASGARIADDTVYANNLGGNQTQDFKVFEFVQSDKVEALKTATFKIVSVSQF